jgi:OOP family OmpA-OmpF porin
MKLINHLQMKLLKTLLLLCLISTAAHAQFVTNSKRVADVYFHNKEYYAAAEYYKRALQISADSVGFVVPYGFENTIKQESPKKDDYEYNVFQLAESLRLYKNFKDAENWYLIARGFSNPKYILSMFWYGETLRANQKYTEAIAAFEDFLSRYKTSDEYLSRARAEIASCQFAIYELRYPRMVKLSKPHNSINQKGSNYTPVLNADRFYFTSSRPGGGSGKKEVLTDQDNAKVMKKETPYLNAIYEVSGNPLAETVSINKMTEEARNKEFAAPAFHPNGKAIFITGWTGDGEKKIYQVSSQNAENWSGPVELGTQVNVKGYNSIQPFVTKDGKYLLFSSDQPGSRGKYDLWYCKLSADGTPGKAINMGAAINSPEDEQAPYFNGQTRKLLFSSNGRVGMGGFDFYESEGDFSSWSVPANLGYPFNSSKDDLYFTPANADDTEGYISSDRESLCCLEVFTIRRFALTVRGTLLDCNTSKPIPNAKVTLKDSLQTFSLMTDASGSYLFKVNSNRKLSITAEKDKYFTKVLNYTYDEISKNDTLFSPEICLVPFEVDKPIVLKDVLYEFDKAEITEASKVKLDYLYTIMIDNPGIEIELSAHTDSKGADIYNLDLSNRRAKACVDYLISKGISAARMASRGYGETRPVAPNQLPNGKDNPEGRALNRRTEFKVTRK